MNWLQARSCSMFCCVAGETAGFVALCKESPACVSGRVRRCKIVKANPLIWLGVEISQQWQADAGAVHREVSRWTQWRAANSRFRDGAPSRPSHVTSCAVMSCHVRGSRAGLCASKAPKAWEERGVWPASYSVATKVAASEPRRPDADCRRCIRHSTRFRTS